MEDHNMKEKYLKPKQYVLEMQPCELLVVSVGSVSSNLDGNESVSVSEEPVDEGFWGR